MGAVFISRWVAIALLAATTVLGVSTIGALSAANAVTTTPTPSPSAQLNAGSPVYPAGPSDVVFGAYIVSVQAVNFVTSTFTADFYFWMRWSNPELHPDERFEIMNASGNRGDQLTPLEVWPIEKEPDGTFYRSFHYQGTFSFEPDLADYPFGNQVLPIVLEGTLGGDYAINFIPDTVPVVTDPGLTLPGYSVGSVELTTAVYQYATDFGGFGNGQTADYSRVVITMPIAHPFWSSLVKYLLPLMLVVITASLIFLIPPRLSSARIILSVTSMLTLVTLDGRTANELPSGDSLMLIDVLFILSYVFIVATIFHAITQTWNIRNDEESLGITPHWRTTVAYLAVYFAVCGLTTYLFI